MAHVFQAPTYRYQTVSFAQVTSAPGVPVDLSLNIIGKFFSKGGFNHHNPDIFQPTPHLIAEGHGRMGFGGRTWSVGPGDVFVFFPGLPVDYADEPARPWRYHWIGLAGPAAMPALAAIGLTPDHPIGRIGDQVLLERLLDEGMSGTIGREFPPTRHIALAWQLLMAIATVRGPALKKPDNPVSEAVRDTLAADPAIPIDLGGLARRHGIAPSTLYRRFVAEIGSSPKHHQLQRRLDLAERLLSARCLPVNAVAARCGFRDANYFSRAFRRRYRAAPRDWRSGKGPED